MKIQHSSVNQGLILWNEIVSHHQPHKTLLVCGKQSYQSVKDKVTPLLEKLSGELITFNDFGKQPCIEDIFKGIQVCREKNIDFIVAIGGGHCIDIAKAINILSVQPHPIETEQDISAYIRGERDMAETQRPLVVLPTTCGSGSEATHFAVVYIGSDKFSLAHPSILADWVIVDESLVCDMPPAIATYTALDALCQAIESYWSVGATRESEGYALESLKIISPYIHKGFSMDKAFFSDMAMAANYSGKAINISKTTAPHALSYFLTDHFGVPHGIAVSLTLGAIASYTEEHAQANAQQKLKKIKSVLNLSGDFATSWYQFLARLNIECQLSDYPLEKHHLAEMVSSVNLQRLSNHPVNFSSEQLLQILETRY